MSTSEPPELPPDSGGNVQELSAGPVFEQVVFERFVWTRPRLLDAGLLSAASRGAASGG